MCGEIEPKLTSRSLTTKIIYNFYNNEAYLRKSQSFGPCNVQRSRYQPGTAVCSRGNANKPRAHESVYARSCEAPVLFPVRCLHSFDLWLPLILLTTEPFAVIKQAYTRGCM
jgi:hypothetical protein